MPLNSLELAFDWLLSNSSEAIREQTSLAFTTFSNITVIKVMLSTPESYSSNQKNQNAE